MTQHRRIRLIEKKRKPTFSERLESNARAIAERADRKPSDDFAARTLEQQIALTVDQLDSLRALHERLRHNLVRQECYALNELHDMEMRTPQYSPYRFPEREKLQRRLVKIEDERRRLAIREFEELRSLRGSLLDILQRHSCLKDDGHVPRTRNRHRHES